MWGGKSISDHDYTWFEKINGNFNTSQGVYEGVRLEILYIAKSDENSDLGRTYFSKVNTSRSDKIKVEEKFPILEQGYTIEKLLDGT